MSLDRSIDELGVRKQMLKCTSRAVSDCNGERVMFLVYSRVRLDADEEDVNQHQHRRMWCKARRGEEEEG
jgi:hypothetical protein